MGTGASTIVCRKYEDGVPGLVVWFSEVLCGGKRLRCQIGTRLDRSDRRRVKSSRQEKEISRDLRKGGLIDERLGDGEKMYRALCLLNNGDSGEDPFQTTGLFGI